MPPALLKTHQALEKVVDECCRPQLIPGAGHLFERYEGHMVGAFAKAVAARGENRKQIRK
ncbi:MAG: hypothetical protein U0U25_13680 [Flavobacteriales bacterium]